MRVETFETLPVIDVAGGLGVPCRVDVTMTAKELARSWFERVWNQREVEAIAEMVHPDAQLDAEGGAIRGPAPFLSDHYNVFTTAFPDVRVHVDAVIGEGEDAVVRWTVTGTHSGALGDIAPSGRKVQFSGMSWLRFRDGRMIEGWDRWNAHAVMQLLQKGAASHTARIVG